MTDAGFWDRIAGTYAANPVSDPAAYERKLALTRAHLTPESRVLEFGCGTGTTALRHAPHVAEYVATDYAEAMLAIARERAAEVPTLRFERASVDDFEAPPESFDVVMAHSLLHLLPETEGLARKAQALLRPGGHLVTNTICLSPWSPLRLVLPVARAFGKAPAVRFARAADYERQINACGFETVERYVPKPMVLFLISRKTG